MTKLTATEGHIIVRLRQPDEKFANGLIIPEAFRKNATQAIVVSTAYDQVDTGDVVLISGEYAGAEVNFEGQQFIVLVPQDILAVVE